MRRVMMGLMLVMGLTSLGACASAGGPRTVDEELAELTQMSIKVTNQSAEQYDVYVSHMNKMVLIGSVYGDATTVLRIPESIGRTSGNEYGEGAGAVLRFGVRPVRTRDEIMEITHAGTGTQLSMRIPPIISRLN